MGYGTSLGTAHEDEISYVLEKGLTDKQLADQSEINQNSTSVDFRSRFDVPMPSTMPLEASRKLTDAFKSKGATQVAPENKPLYETALSPEEETNFQAWKAQNAPKDSGTDYDLRGAFKAGLQPDAETGHWPDTFKKPNHPTFSDQSMYAKDRPDLAGSWNGDTYVPPSKGFMDRLSIVKPIKAMLNGPNIEDDQKILKGFWEALKIPGEASQGGTQTPEKSPETKLDTIPDVYPTPDYLNPPEKTMSFRPSATGMIKGFWEALKIPGEASQGKIPMWAMDPETGEFNTSTQAIEKSTELAGLMIGGPAPVAARMADGSLGSFMGVRSKTIDKTKLYKAQEMEMNGVHPDDIWTDTGTFRGADNRWRQEINDKRSNLKEENLNRNFGVTDKDPNKIITNLNDVKTVGIPAPYEGIQNAKTLEDLLKSMAQPKNQKVLGHILNHPTLYDAYPWLQNIKVYPLPKESPYYGLARTGEGQMEIHMAELSVHEFHSTLMHEVQHLIQAHEGFSQGASSSQFLPKELGFNEVSFIKVRDEALSNTEKELGMPTEQVAGIKRAVQQDVEGTLRPDSSGRIKVDFLKEKHPEIYDRLSNIVKYEKLFFDAREKYRAVMGEVEARNVQTRLDMDATMRHLTSPRETEEMIVPRKDQIRSPSDGPSASASEVTPMRRGANDNLPEGHPDRPYNVREPNMIGSKEADDALDASWKAFGDKQRRMEEIIKERGRLINNRDIKEPWTELERARYKKLIDEYEELNKN